MVVLAFTIWGCSDGGGGGGVATSAAPSVQDFANTTITSDTVVAADGSSVMTVVVQLINSDGTFVSNFKPAYSVTPQTGVVASPCTLSNSLGVSTCLFKSTVPGAKTFQLINAKVGLVSTLQFNTINGEQRFAVASGALMNGSTSDGYTVRMSLGGPLQKFNSTTPEGHRLTFFVGKVK